MHTQPDYYTVGETLDALLGTEFIDAPEVPFDPPTPITPILSHDPRPDLGTSYPRMEDFELMVRRMMYLEQVVNQMLPLLQAATPRPAEIRKGQLDRFCLALFQENPEPTPIQLSNMIRDMEEAFPGHDRRELFSVVRRWFRKKREEVGLKVISGLRRMFGGDLKSNAGIIERQLINGTFNYDALVEESRISLEPTEAVLKFCQEKMSSYLNRMIGWVEKGNKDVSVEELRLFVALLS